MVFMRKSRRLIDRPSLKLFHNGFADVIDALPHPFE